MSQSTSLIHFLDLYLEQTQKQHNTIAMQFKQNNDWLSISWMELQRYVFNLSHNLLEYNIKNNDRIAILAANAPEWSMLDIACMHIRAITVPIYTTSSLEQIEYILNDSQAIAIMLDSQEQFDTIIKIIKNLKHLQYIICMHNEINTELSQDHQAKILLFNDLITKGDDICTNLIKAELENKSLDDIATIIYTSGTTGKPKGVMLSHTNIASTIAQHKLFLNLTSNDKSLAFLPLSHIFERGWSLYVLSQGATNCYLNDPNDVKDALLELQPHVMCSVPRLYEKIYQMVLDKAYKNNITKKLFHWCLKQGIRYNIDKNKNPLTALGYRIAYRILFHKIQHNLGGHIKFMPSGGAILNKEVHTFFVAAGIKIVAGYGMTETTATITANRLNNIVPGSTGIPLPDIEVQITEEGEILVKGNTIMSGYYNLPEETQKVMTEDGWFKTGDCGYFDEQGNLFITDRLKDLMKTSYGKYIAPQRIESIVSQEPWIEQIAIIAEAKNYVSALIVPTFEKIETWAKEHNITYQNRQELLNNKKLIAFFQEKINTIQEKLAKFEKIKKFKLLTKEFTVTDGEITPTFKIKRNIINEKYKKQITEMYDNLSKHSK